MLVTIEAARKIPRWLWMRSERRRTSPILQLTVPIVNFIWLPNYSEVVNENAPQGTQTDRLKYQAPDRLGGYIQSGSKRTYVYVIGSTQYQSGAVPNNTLTKQLTFHQQASQGATALDPPPPTATSLMPIRQSTRHAAGDTYSFTLNQGGKTGTFSYTVNGQYVSTFTLRVSNSSVRLDISAVGTSPPVTPPTGSKISPASSAPTTAPSP